MKILLIQPGFGRGLGFQQVALVEPLGLETVAATLLASGRTVKILDLRIEKKLEKWIRDFDPALCGIGCSFTIDVYQTLRIAQAVKRIKKNAFVIVGGHHASLSPNDLNHPAVDAVVIGEGEETARELAAALEEGRDLKEVPGLALNQNGVQQLTGIREQVNDLDDLPLPARHLLQKNAKRYFMGFQRPLVMMETGRGCPHRCEFCSVWRFFQGKCRTKSPERVVEEIATIQAEFVIFVDDNFFLSVPRARQIAEILITKGIRRKITVQVRSDTIVAHPDLLTLWTKAGLWKVFIGLEKVGDDELSSLGKRNSVRNNEEAIKILQAHNIEICASFIVDPQYDHQDFARLKNYLRKWNLQFPSLTVLTPLPGTDLFQRLKAKLTTQNLELFDCAHTVLPTRLSLPEFYREYSSLWKSGFLPKGVRWVEVKAFFHRLTTSPQLFIMLKSAWIMKGKEYFLAGHEAQPPYG